MVILIIHIFLKNQIDTMIQLLNENPLHIWKNTRSRVLDNKIVINPHVKSRYVTGLNINKVLHL